MAGNFVMKVITARISQQTKSKNHITGEKIVTGKTNLKNLW